MSAVRLSPEAVTALAEAGDWYASRRPGLDVEFLTEFERIRLLAEVRVLALAHVKLRPGYWLNRVET